MDAPQSREDVEPIELAIRREIDDALRIRWNPRSYVTRPGAFDAYGNPIGPRYEGRWEVVKPVDGVDAVIYQLRFDGDGGEAYRAVGWWLLDFLRKWDRANRFYVEELQRMYGEDAEAERAAATATEEAEREWAEEKSFQLAGNYGRQEWYVSGFGTRTRGDQVAASPDASPNPMSVP